MKIEKGIADKRLARINQWISKAKALKPSLGRVAVSAFYDYCYREGSNM